MSEYIQQRYRYAAVYIIYANFHTSLQPDEFDLENPQNTKERAILEYLEEVKLVEDVEEIGHGPAYIDHVRQPAGSFFPYPGGNVHYIVMSRVPRENLLDIYMNLTDDQLEGIRRQIAYVFEYVFATPSFSFPPCPW